jgi:hypothetical protein
LPGFLLSDTHLQRLSRRLLLPEWVLLQWTGLRARFAQRRSAAKSSILEPGDHVNGVKVGLKILDLTVMFDFDLFD